MADPNSILSVLERCRRLPKFDGVDYSSSQQQREGSSDRGSAATMAVLTLVLAIDGDSTKIRQVQSIACVKEILWKIAANAKVADCLQSVGILWTPEERSETLSQRDIVADYP